MVPLCCSMCFKHVAISPPYLLMSPLKTSWRSCYSKSYHPHSLQSIQNFQALLVNNVNCVKEIRPFSSYIFDCTLKAHSQHVKTWSISGRLLSLSQLILVILRSNCVLNLMSWQPGISPRSVAVPFHQILRSVLWQVLASHNLEVFSFTIKHHRRWR